MPPDAPLWIRLLQKHYLPIQIGIGLFFLFITWLFFRPRTPDSQFRVREADLRKNRLPPWRGARDRLAHSKVSQPRPQGPLSLSGIRLDVPPHELLGVGIHATSTEIQTAYRSLMKRYHPDVVGRPGTREWKDAQKIAESLTAARDSLLKNRK